MIVLDRNPCFGGRQVAHLAMRSNKVRKPETIEALNKFRRYGCRVLAPWVRSVGPHRSVRDEFRAEEGVRVYCEDCGNEWVEGGEYAETCQ